MADNTVIRANTAVFTKLPQAIERDVRLSQHGSLVTTQVEPKYAELARARVLYGANNGSAVGLANVAAIPTTTASYALYNGSTSKHAVVLKISVMVTTITAPTEFGLIAGLSPTAQAAAETKYANSLALAITPGSAAPESYLTDAVTLAGTPLWMTLGGHTATTPLLGGQITAYVDGMFIVPPKFALGIDVVGSGGSTPLFDVDILWAELEMELG